MFHSETVYSYIFGDRVFSLAKDLVDRETNILLLDEFDKAHPLFYSAFYEMFDEGIYEDKYYNVDLSNSIIFCTFNYQLEKEIADNLGVALFSRFDNIIEYKELNKLAKTEILKKVYEAEIKRYNEEDKVCIEELDALNKMKNVVDQYENARDIQRNITKVLSYPLVKRL